MGRHACNVLLLFPRESLWRLHVTGRISKGFEALERSFRAVGGALLAAHHDFDLLFEDQALGGLWAPGPGGKWRLGNETHGVVVVPPAPALPIGVL
ncbi:MAG: hypothetical protein Kow0069_35350 [Promethearchaeota archaeon]